MRSVTQACRATCAQSSARSSGTTVSLSSRTPMPISSARSRNTYTQCASPCASCGATEALPFPADVNVLGKRAARRLQRTDDATKKTAEIQKSRRRAVQTRRMALSLLLTGLLFLHAGFYFGFVHLSSCCPFFLLVGS